MSSLITLGKRRLASSRGKLHSMRMLRIRIMKGFLERRDQQL
jgi:hypothetical protein